MNDTPAHADQQILSAYRLMVSEAHLDEVSHWPVLCGADVKQGSIGDWRVFFFRHTGTKAIRAVTNVGEIPTTVVQAPSVSAANLEQVRDRLLRHFRATADDAVVLVPPSNELPDGELNSMIQRHRTAMGLVPMKVFLSHKNPDKTFVRDVKATLEALGFEAWLDEDAMPAGVQLERGLQAGMKASCAAVFFLTPNFSDEAYLAAEIDYAIGEKRTRGDAFSIISLVLPKDGSTPPVPNLLRPYVWKQPSSDLEALREILRALPVKVGEVRLR